MEWHPPHYRIPGIFGVHPIHILAFRKHTNFELWYDLFYHMESEEDLHATFGYGFTAKDLAMQNSSLEMIKLLYMQESFLKLTHFYRLGNVLSLPHYHMMHSTYTSLGKGLSNSCLPYLTPYTVHNTIYEGAPSYFTPLFVAVLANIPSFLEKVISKGAKPSLQPPTPEGNYGLLHLAARLDHYKLIPILVNAGCDVNGKAQPFEFTRTALVIAAHYGNLRCIKALINCPGFNLQLSAGPHALMSAAQQGQFHVIPTLVRIGCNVDDSPYVFLYRPVHMAAVRNQLGVLRTLLRLGADPFLLTSNGRNALHYAAEYDSAEVISTLVQTGLSPYEPQKRDENFVNLSPYGTAVLFQSLSVLQALVHSNCVIPNTSQVSLLHVALSVRYNSKLPSLLSKQVSISFLTELINLGCSVSVIDESSGMACLHIAAHFDDPAVIHLLIKFGCPKNKFTRTTSGCRATAMHVAAERNSVSSILALVANGCDVNFHHPLEKPPLHAAIIAGSLSAVERLLEFGASTSLRDHRGYLPIHAAIYYENIEAIELIVKYDRLRGNFLSLQNPPNVEIHDEISKTLLVLAQYGVNVSNGGIPFSEMCSPQERAAKMLRDRLLSCKQDVSFSPLEFATRAKKRSAIKKLVDLGADVNANPLVTPLHIASALGYADIAHYLIQMGADYSIVDSCGFNAMHTAIKYNHAEVVQTFIDEGCDPTLPTIIKGEPDLSPFQLACIMCCPQIVALLYEVVPDIHQLTPDHLSPLHLAIIEPGSGLTYSDGHVTMQTIKINMERQEKTLELLLRFGCNVNATDDHCGITPLDLAAKYKLEKISLMLFEAGGERGTAIMNTENLKARIAQLENNYEYINRKVDTMEAALQRFETQQREFQSQQDRHCAVNLTSFHVPYDARTMERFLQNVYDNFIMCAHAKKVASELRRRRVIPEAVETKIERALDRKTANGHLYDHLFSQGTFKTLQIVCDVFIHEEGYPRMNELGKSMKDQLAHMHAASSENGSGR
jgi:ankyrin repeat protein